MALVNGYFTMPRWLEMHPIRRNPNAWTVLTFCVSQASWRDTYSPQWGEVKKGQLITSALTIQQHTGLSRQNVRTAISNLQLTNLLTIKATKQFSLITLSDQLFTDEEGNELTNELTINPPKTNQQLTTSETVNRNRIYIKPDSGESGVPASPPPQKPKPKKGTTHESYLQILNGDLGNFEEWWNLYPRKEDKKPAAKAYKAARAIAQPEEILGGLRRQLPELNQREHRLIPLPATWLNKERWENPAPLFSSAAAPGNDRRPSGPVVPNYQEFK